MKKLQDIEYFRLIEVPAEITPELTVEKQNKAFVGFLIRNQYDKVRHNIPDDYNPVYIQHNDGNTYYGVWLDLSKKGVEFNNLVKDLIDSQVFDPVAAYHVGLNDFYIKINESSLLMNKDTLAITFEAGRELIDETHHNLDTIAYNSSEAPCYIKVAGMYIFLFYY